MENYRYERVGRICEDLEALMTVQSAPILGWKMKKGFFLTPEQADQSEIPW